MNSFITKRNWWIVLVVATILSFGLAAIAKWFPDYGFVAFVLVAIILGLAFYWVYTIQRGIMVCADPCAVHGGPARRSHRSLCHTEGCQWKLTLRGGHPGAWRCGHWIDIETPDCEIRPVCHRRHHAPGRHPDAAPRPDLEDRLDCPGHPAGWLPDGADRPPNA